jgi:hypothetical protein
MSLTTKVRITPYQKALLKKFAESQYGDLHVGSLDRRSAHNLLRAKFLKQGPQQWFSITQEGRDYLEQAGRPR